jgi:TonB family protein
MSAVRTFATVSAMACLAFAELHAQQPDSATRSFTGPCARSGGRIDESGLTEDPEVPARIRPGSKLLPFPKELRRMGVQMTVVISFIVESDGKLRRNSLMVLSSPDSILSDWACRTVSGLKFTPAQNQGRAVAAQTMLPLTFDTTQPRDTLR